MAEAFEEYIMREHAGTPKAPSPKAKGGVTVKSLLKGESLREAYNQYCKAQKLQPDPSVSRMLDMGLEMTKLDVSSLVFSPLAFEAIMQVCTALPHLEEFDASSCNLRLEHISHLVNMAAQHKTLSSISIAKNGGLGFSAARLLLPMIKENMRIHELDMSGTSIAVPTQELIAKVLEANQLYAPKEGEEVDDDDFSDISDMSDVSDPMDATWTPGPSPKAEDDTPKKGGLLSKLSPRKLKSTSPTTPVILRQPVDAIADRANRTLRGQLTSQLEKEGGMYKQFLDDIPDHQDRIFTHSKKVQNTMHEYGEVFKYAQPHGLSVDSFVVSLDLNLRDTDLQKLYDDYTPAAKFKQIPLKAMLVELLDPSTSKRTRKDKLKELKKTIAKHGPNMAEFTTMVGRFTELMNEDASQTEDLAQMLSKTDSQIQILNKDISEMTSTRKEALLNEELRAADAYFDKNLDMHQELLDILLKRVTTLRESATRSKFLAALDDIKATTSRLLADTRDANDDTMAALDEDLAKLRAKIISEIDLKQKREKDKNEHVRVVNADLQANREEQDRVWEQITESFLELEQLGQAQMQRIEEFNTHIEETSKREMEGQATIQICEEHVRTLDALRNDVMVCGRLLDHFESGINQCENTARANATSNNRQNEQAQKEEGAKYLTAFRNFLLDVGDVCYKKEKLLAEVNRQFRSSEFQIDFCKETLDPSIVQYKELHKDIIVRQMDLTKRTTRYEQVKADRVTQFLDHEHILIESGLEFESPVLESNDRVVDGRLNLLKKRQTFMDKDTQELVVNEKQDIERQRTTTQEYRMGKLDSTKLSFPKKSQAEAVAAVIGRRPTPPVANIPDAFPPVHPRTPEYSADGKPDSRRAPRRSYVSSR